MTDYYQKYLKYKKKYLELKGGAVKKEFDPKVVSDIKQFLDSASLAYLARVNKTTAKNAKEIVLDKLTINEKKFNYILNNDVTISVKELIFDISGNINIDLNIFKKIKNYPNTLTHLNFGWEFNQPIEVRVLPQSLTHLTFDGYFNQPIEKDVLPQSLTHLVLPIKYSHTIPPRDNLKITFENK
jgi:hypothetical protein